MYAGGEVEETRRRPAPRRNWSWRRALAHWRTFIMRFARVAFWLFLLSIAALRPVVAQQYVISTVAGGGPPSMPASGVAGPIGTPQRVATCDAAGSVYFTSFNSVFKLDQSGILTRVAGISKLGYSGDGGPAASARLQVGVGGADVARPGGLDRDTPLSPITWKN